MKELFKDEFESTKVDKEVVASIQKKKEHKLIGKQKAIKGHLLFKFNPKTMELSTNIKYKKTDLFIGSIGDKVSTNTNTSVEIEDGFIYIQALNRKNAIKKLNKIGYQTELKRKELDNE